MAEPVAVAGPEPAVAPSVVSDLNASSKPRKLRGWLLRGDKHGSEEKTYTYEVKSFIKEAAALNIELRVVTPDQVDLLVHRDDPKSILLLGESVRAPDFLLPRTGAATSYFSHALIRQLERIGVFCVNGSDAIAMAADKMHTSQALASRDIHVPATMLMKFPLTGSAVNVIEKRLGGFPVVLKLLSGSQGNGVFLCDTKQRFEDLIELLEATSAKSTVIVQQFINTSRGRDLRVFVFGGKVLALMERRAAEGKFKANIHQGGKGVQYELDPELESICLDSASTLGLNMAGVDVLFDQDTEGKILYKICEVNSSPGFEGLERANPELNVARHIMTWVADRLRTEDAPKSTDKN